MTDFIHEQPDGKAVPPPEPEKPAMSERDRQKRVFAYAAVLFTVAFILILWTFLMSHRSNQAVLSELKGSANALQTSLEQNIALEAQVKELQQHADALEDTVQTLEAQLRQLEIEKTEALENAEDWEQASQLYARFDLLEYRYAQDDYEACLALIEQLEPLSDRLPAEQEGGAPSVRERYQAIVEALAERGA